jgi:predicted Rossmann fold nucleotide-binding protein DprA/Smf involved in DNA uptake
MLITLRKIRPRLGGVFLCPQFTTSALVALSVANTPFHLAAVPNQSYPYANGNEWKLTMLKQQDMTEAAKAVLNELSAEPATVGEIAQNTHLTREHCQLILTQLVMAGLSDYQLGCYMRLRA